MRPRRQKEGERVSRCHSKRCKSGLIWIIYALQQIRVTNIDCMWRVAWTEKGRRQTGGAELGDRDAKGLTDTVNDDGQEERAKNRMVKTEKNTTGRGKHFPITTEKVVGLLATKLKSTQKWISFLIKLCKFSKQFMDYNKWFPGAIA